MFGFFAGSSNLEDAGVGTAESQSGFPPTRKGTHGLPPDSAMEPLIHAPSALTPAIGSQETRERAKTATGTLVTNISSSQASSVERIDKVWVMATMAGYEYRLPIFTLIVLLP